MLHHRCAPPCAHYALRTAATAARWSFNSTPPTPPPPRTSRRTPVKCARSLGSMSGQRRHRLDVCVCICVCVCKWYTTHNSAHQRGNYFIKNYTHTLAHNTMLVATSATADCVSVLCKSRVPERRHRTRTSSGRRRRRRRRLTRDMQYAI